MKTKIALSASTCVLAVVAICFYARSASQQEQFLYAKQEISDYYRNGVGSLARRLAELHVKEGHAMYVGLGGPVQLDPQPIYGYPVCQLGCITKVFFVGDTEASVDDCFAEEYNRYLRSHPREDGGPQLQPARSTDAASEGAGDAGGTE